MNTLFRTLCVAVLCTTLTPVVSAQNAAATVDCDNIPELVGAADAAYEVCAVPSTDQPLRSLSTAPSFGHDDRRSAFVAFSQSRPQVYAPVIGFDPSRFLNAGDFRGNDLTTWFGLEQAGRAMSVNVETGEMTSLGRINPPAGQTWTALTWDYQDEVFYALAADCGSETSLFTVDFENGTKRRVGQPASLFNIICGIALASDPADGTLYAYGISYNRLVTFDKTTGAATVIGPLDFDPNAGQEMDFDNVDGTLFAYAYNNATQRGELRTVNTANARTALVGPLGGAFPGGANQIGAGSSRTALRALSITALTTTPTVAQGGTAEFAYQVCNGTNGAASGRAFYQVKRNGQPITSRVPIGAGSVPAGSCSSNLSFGIAVPSDLATGSYSVTVSAGSDASSIVTRTTVSVEVTSANAVASAVTDWTLTDATPWAEHFETTASATTAPETGAYPNPFAERTTLSFSLADASNVRLTVYDVLGREVAVLLDGSVEAGTHTATFEARGLATGTYVWRLVAGETVQSGRITLVQ